MVGKIGRLLITGCRSCVGSTPTSDSAGVMLNWMENSNFDLFLD